MSCLYAWAVLVPERFAIVHTEREITYRLEAMADDAVALRKRFTEGQLAILEKLNRADIEHLARLRTLVVPEQWLRTNWLTA
jgi:hypothetical protein